MGAGAFYFRRLMTPTLTTWVEIIGLAAIVGLISWRLDRIINPGKRRSDHALPRSGIFRRV